MGVQFRNRLLKELEAAVVETQQQWTPGALERYMAAREGASRAQVRQAIRVAIELGLLEYGYHFGQSCLVASFRRPVLVGNTFVIVPPTWQGPITPQRLPLIIAAGSAFGCGRHPTTRLALRALEKGWAHLRAANKAPAPAVIDIGTGSGILAIAAARLGAAKVRALDIDACARAEARKNIALNSGIVPVVVSDTELEAVPDSYAMIIANLRLPTLVGMGSWIEAHLNSRGCLVVSGLRVDEAARLTDAYAGWNFGRKWWAEEAGWSGGVFIKESRAEI